MKKHTISHILKLGIASTFLLTMVFPAGALAADGRLEINQACVATGCFPGDEPAFPVNITSPGSYLLTSNLDLGEFAHNTTGILIEPGGSGAIIDLNGFSIIGLTTCSDLPVTSCENTGFGDGINSLEQRITVMNGHIFGMGSDGITLAGAGSRVENVMIQSCGANGIDVGNDTIVKDNVVIGNGDDGIEMMGGLAIGNVSRGNGEWGVDGAISTGLVNNYFGINGSGFFDSSHQLATNLCSTIVCP